MVDWSGRLESCRGAPMTTPTTERRATWVKSIALNEGEGSDFHPDYMYCKALEEMVWATYSTWRFGEGRRESGKERKR